MNFVSKLKDSKLLANGLWLMILQVFNTVVPMITLPYVTRVLTPSGYGSFSLALNWILYFQVLVEYGFGFLGARKATNYGSTDLQKLYSQIITARLLLLLITFLLMNLIYLVSNTSITHYYCMLILFLMVIGTAFQLTWLFQGKQDMKFITLVNAASRLLSVVLIFLIIKSPNDVYMYSFLYSCTYIFSSLIGIFVAKRIYGLRIKLSKFSSAFKLLIEGWPLFVSQAMSKIVSGFGITVLGMVATNNIVGIYSAVYKLPYTLVLFFSPVSQALFPDVALKFSSSNSVGINRVKKFARLIIPIFVIISLVLILFRKLVIEMVFGQAYEHFSFIMIPLCLWLLFSIINNFLGVQMLVASGNQKYYGNAFTISAILSIILNFALGFYGGIAGVAWATFCSELILSVLLIRTNKKVFKLI